MITNRVYILDSIFDINKLENIGIFAANISSKVLSMAIQDSRSGIDNLNIKARIFVGSNLYLNDKWDSGIVDTTLNYMYYGGGNNLEAGEKYYMNLQVYSEKYGWSEIQTKEFIMPT